MQLPFLATPERSAVISECGRYRYRLGRRWGDGPAVMFVMLNPSRADADIDDPTIRRCIGFARSWGFGGLLVGNLFAFRATDPAEMRRAEDPVGPENDDHLRAMAGDASLIVAAWGTHGTFLGRGATVRAMFPGMNVLRLTGSGQPQHPLYLPAALEPVEWPKEV